MARLYTSLDAFLYRLGVYGVPLAIAAVSLVALAAWEPEFPVAGAAPLAFSVLEEGGGGALTPAQALERLGRAPELAYRDTRLSERPFWLRFAVAPAADDGPSVVELPSRHATDAVCWNADGLAWLGSASRAGTSGRMRAARAGFAVTLPRATGAVRVLCRARFEGPGRITVVRWPTAEFEIASRQFERNAGLLEGGLLVLSAFVLVTALVNREWLYVLFAAWLLASLRLAAISAGWDTHWLDRMVPEGWSLPMRKLTIALYYCLTYTLFTRLFRDELRRVGHARLLLVAQWSCVLLLAAAVVLPFASFLPYLWLTSALGIAIIVFLLARILLATRSRVAMWYSASLAIVLFSGLYEVVAAALGVKELIGAVNSVTAAFSSSLMAALAIAEQMSEERRGRVKAQNELRGTYEAIPIGLFTLDRDGYFTRVNPSLSQMLSIDQQADRRAHWSDYFEQGAWRALQEASRVEGTHEMEVRSFGREGGGAKRFLVKAITSADKVEGSLQDITEKYKAHETLRFLAEHDPLTGVLNRRGIEKVLERAFARGTESRKPALAYLDLDRFKLINELFGHVAGDEVLRQVCERVRAVLGSGHDVGRIGGDEFVIVLRDLEFTEAAALCRRIVESIENPNYQTGDKAFQVKGSIGLIELGADSRVTDVLSMADRACRAAKKSSGDGLVVFERSAPEFGERERELRLVERLGTGTPPEGMFLVMQPIMSLGAPFESLNFEVLVRLREDDGSVTSAGKIIEAAENNGRAAVIDRWVLSRTLEWLERHRQMLRNTRFACMNLSGASLNDERFVHDAYAMLARSGRAAERLCIEITEGVALHDMENTRRFIERVRGYGAKVALDDFGAGYTSFSYLKELPADAVKIDGSFISGVNAHPANLAIVGTIVELARNLGMQSVAEWVEDRATIEALAQVGVDYVQGWAISRPVEPARILTLASSADFIVDPEVASFVRTALAPGRTLGLWEQLDEQTRAGLH